MRNLYIFTILMLCIFISCGQSNKKHSSDKEIIGGTYCAEIEYYNPKTGTRSTYTLDVEVEDGELVKIYWSNGGWLDETHFVSQDITDGYCSFTSDKGYEYEVTLTEKGGGCGDDSYDLSREIEEDEEAITCPECGDEKDFTDEYCSFCERKFKCPECGDRKHKYDDLCYYCQSKVDEEER
ncbi:conserved exported hypothetical protein [Capnocytophaga canimorsus]|uniref:Uncharacterized protein n=1 Tax=Capnocytophaga canimorsus TaxID=28188 RepID=A0A0B7HL14_9FLAO|nr:hypothetical protein [Capnocytophaga canimorsus]PJI83551.1 hypothetical protein CLV61_0150 [Capnocytophaga canimorsus]CEN39344.1 conserved exported hypothetical protein [Capnocytophaga canimorsus]STA72526.1 Uncharacterised protein [Capnocytophaga canimorsus]